MPFVLALEKIISRSVDFNLELTSLESLNILTNEEPLSYSLLCVYFKKSLCNLESSIINNYINCKIFLLSNIN